MKPTIPRHLLPLAPLAILLACDTGPRELPSGPNSGITALVSTSHRPSAPSPRGYALTAYDPVRDRVYEVGGFFAPDWTAEIDDIWAFRPRSRTWSLIANTLPAPLGDAVALDVKSRKLIMYLPYIDPIETWAYDIETGVWENRRPATEPPPRWGSMMVYDPKADRILLYGGTDWNDGSTVLGDLWAYDYEANTWSALHPPVSPPPHHFPVLEYVPTIDRVMLFGGYQQGFSTLFNDTWAYDYRHNRWTNLHPANPPAPRAYHYMAYDPTTNRIVLFGGVMDESAWPDSPELTNDETWIYSVARNSWHQMFPKHAPSPRAWHVMSHTDGPVMLFGGGPSRLAYNNETYLYDSHANEWELVSGGEHAVADRAVASGVATMHSTGGRPLSQGAPPLRR